MDCRLKNQVQATQEVINMTDSAMSKMQKGKQPMLTAKQKTLPEGLKKKIIEAKKSGAGYSGD